ncbi:MAG TPA: nucleotidyl transferase AbiEii/AbiGii toxin family protein [Trueperaceae bacterium]|nr:nucleotidyl transferase AbiEii/AbiGii toxin family protein [Trueperaceae bacterium]
MPAESFTNQARLLVRALPVIAEEKTFALKGGTGINLFHRNMPRLSVDIDLVYLHIQPREVTLASIGSALERLALSIEARIPGAVVRPSLSGGDDLRLEIRAGRVAIKVDTSPVFRGTVHPPVVRRTTPEVERAFGFAEMNVVAFEDLYAGKLVAALDRQHPRDLYDVQLLYDNEGVTDTLFRTFLVYLASSSRPPHELLNPNRVEIEAAYRNEFEGMTVEPLDLDELIATRERLFANMRELLDDSVKSFLLSLHDADPDFSAIGFPEAIALPAVQWKLQNLRRLRDIDADKHSRHKRAIEELFE